MNLPKSVLSLIVSHIDPGENLGTSSTLANLCLVSKELNSIATPVLWHKIRIDDMRHGPDKGFVELQESMGFLDPFEEGQVRRDKMTKGPTGWLKTLGRESEYVVQNRNWEERHATGEIELDSDGEVEEWFEYDEEEYDCGDEGYILDSFSYDQLAALENFAHLRPYVKLVDFHGRLEGNVPSKMIQRILKLCPNLETVHLFRAHVRYLLEDSLLIISSLVKYSTNLRRLDILDFDDDSADHHFLSTLAKLSELRHLSLTCKSREWPEWHVTRLMLKVPPLLQQLRSLHIGSTISPEFFSWFSHSSTSSLTSLGVAVRRNIPDLKSFVNLQHITVTFDKIQRATSTLRTLSKTTQLKSLELRYSHQALEAERADKSLIVQNEEYRSSEEGEDEEEEAEAQAIPSKKPRQPINYFILLFRAMPSTLHTLSIPYVLSCTQEADFKKAFNSKSVPSGLRTIQLVRAGPKRLSDAEEVEMRRDGYRDPREEARIHQEKWLGSISKVLEKKGIDLVRVPDWQEQQNDRSFLSRTRLN